MAKKKLNGAEAIAHGALNSGIRMATAYPGSPATAVMDAVIEFSSEREVYAEWSGNEKVAVELAIGCSMAGYRSLVCLKSVGMNVAIDPLMTLNLTELNGGLVILLGDDPGAYGSQNDQDTRPIANLLEIPMLEPGTPTEGMTVMEGAFQWSEEFQLPVIIRITRAFTAAAEEIALPANRVVRKGLGLQRAPFRYTPCPVNAVQKHADLHQRVGNFAAKTAELSFDRAIGRGKCGVIVAGFVFQKLRQVLEGKLKTSFRIMKVTSLYPIAQEKMLEFLASCEMVLVLEENAPFVEVAVRVLVQAAGLDTEVYGKQTGDVAREGELFRWQIREALQAFVPGFNAGGAYTKENEKQEYPAKRNYCKGCNYDKILDALDEAAQKLEQKPVIIGDPGCLASVAERLDAKYAMGSAIAVADGLSKMGIEERAVAMFGDASFFHLTLPAMCNAAFNQSDVLMVLLDNQSAATSGFQPTPGMGKNARGEAVPALDMETLARACGVENVTLHPIADFGEALVEVFAKALSRRQLELIILRLPGQVVAGS